MKRLLEKTGIGIKTALSLFWYATGITALIHGALKRYFHTRRPVLVLCYHGITEQQAKGFQYQLEFLFDQGYQFVSGREMMGLLSNPGRSGEDLPAVCLTFDDCYENNYSVVRPILERKLIPAIFFAPSAKLGNRPDWTTQKKDQRIMTESQLKEMAESFEIGAHTQNHVCLDKASAHDCRQEIQRSKDDLTHLLGRSTDFMAYPHGKYTGAVVDMVRHCRYDAAFTIEQHINYGGDDPYVLGRYIIDPDDRALFRMKVRGGYDWFYFAKKALVRWSIGPGVDTKARSLGGQAS
jgi:peptidoglycan/xylan/chitin deacetylase (PgdA/CDA1 family)